MNKTFRNRISVLLAILLLLALALPGCQKQPAEDGQTKITDSTNETTLQQNDGNATEETTVPQDEKNELWVVYGTDSRTGFPPIKYIERDIVEPFIQKYPDVAVRLEAIPKEEEDLQRLRTQIMAGKGPDLFLMCRNSTLIPDPYQAMRNGLFMDISEYYDTDTSIKKEELNQTVMDAGVYDGHRYIIPFTFDFPVAYVDTAQFEDLGGSMDMFDGGIMKLYEDLFATGNPDLIYGARISEASQRFHGFNYLPELLDYEEQEILITAEEIAQFLRAVQTARAAYPFEAEELPNPTYLDEPSFTYPDIESFRRAWWDYTSMYIGVMPTYVLDVGYKQISGSDLEIKAIPVAAADGDLVADVLFYGAVGAGCEKPDLAYEFLRVLFERIQQTYCVGPYGQLSIGWPVRIAGSAENAANNGNYRAVFYGFRYRFPHSELPVITNDDIPFLDAKIDRVQFYTSLEKELSDIIDTLNDPNTGAPTDVDIDAVAAEFVDELKWHLYEG